jgi:hypothetical protein
VDTERPEPIATTICRSTTIARALDSVKRLNHPTPIVMMARPAIWSSFAAFSFDIKNPPSMAKGRVHMIRGRSSTPALVCDSASTDWKYSEGK